jgi:hypothetical protein
LVDAKQAFDLVLAQAGCWPRDRVTLRTVEEVKTKSGAWGRNAPAEPTDEWFLDGLAPGRASVDSDDDGIPDKWEKMHGLDPANPRDASRMVPPGASGDDRHRGYSYIEFYLNELADQKLPEAVMSP